MKTFIKSFCAILIMFTCLVLVNTNAQAQKYRANTKHSRTVKATTVKPGVVGTIQQYCKPASSMLPYVNHAKQSNGNYHKTMQVFVTLVSDWNNFTGWGVTDLYYNPAKCAFEGTIQLRFSDRTFTCGNSGGFNLPIPFSPNSLETVPISINIATQQVVLKLWGTKIFKMNNMKNIWNGFENNSNFMLAITAEKGSVPIIK